MLINYEIYVFMNDNFYEGLKWAYEFNNRVLFILCIKWLYWLTEIIIR